ncbi:hypothetical protein BD626DRAFT_404673 [Schizophyllum amplum]|uniref:RNase H type-1 domain-containing protein n=1 Tax=Schizophyllum amplum TaxID=97359 RepID=A0A550CB40_9AGAR|nr:hypothetical protein BD626DRAFT_404673 [Auriculariopsis ampla]
MLAIMVAADEADPDRELRIETDSRWALGELLEHRAAHEDAGYIDAVNGELTKATIASLRRRRAHTYFRWVKGHNGHAGNEIADRLAGEGARKEAVDFELLIEPNLRLSGAKLATMTQSRAYKAILKQKISRLGKRKRTEQNMAQILDDLDEEFWIQRTEASIWRAVRSKHILLECRYFLWMVIHDAYHIGDKWLKPNYPPDVQERAFCRICGAAETMHHILLDCECVERCGIWNLVEELWSLTGETWHEPSLGVIVGAACGTFRTDKGRPKSGTERLWAIIISESAHLVWKMRCERVIQNDGREFTEVEVRNRWMSILNQRLELDRRLTYKRYGKAALSASLVDSTWKSIIRDYESLPDEWVGNCGVLVGIRSGEG